MPRRAYTVRTVALAIDVPAKWVDNLLSHHRLIGVAQSRQGVGRVISDEGVLAIQLVRLLADLGIGTARAAEIASQTLASRTSGEARFVDESGIELLFHIGTVERRLRERMVDALDAVPRVRRGRPPRAQ